MSTILFFPYSYELGTTISLVDIAITLRKYGHDCIFAGEGYYMSLAKSHKFKIVNISEVDFDTYRKHIDGGNIDFHTVLTIRKHVKEEIKLYELIKPNLIISQARTTPAISARLANIPLISVTIAFLTKYYGLPLVVPETFSIYPLTKIPLLGRYINSNADKVVRFKSLISVRPYNKVAKEYGLKPFKDMYELYAGTLMTLVPEFNKMFPFINNYPKDVYVFTGPILHHRHFKTPKWFMEHKRIDGQYLYLSMGTSSRELYPEVLRRLLRIYGNRKGYFVITNTCDLIKNIEKELTDNVSNFIITKTAPAELMLKLADLTITHGGKNTIYHSLINGVPIFGIPQQAEQEINLRRVKELNLGDYILSKDFKRSSDEILFEKINKVLNNKIIEKNVLTIADEIKDSMKSLKSVIKKINIYLNNNVDSR